jgi:hypothetical protein
MLLVCPARQLVDLKPVGLGSEEEITGGRCAAKIRNAIQPAKVPDFSKRSSLLKQHFLRHDLPTAGGSAILTNLHVSTPGRTFIYRTPDMKLHHRSGNEFRDLFARSAFAAKTPTISRDDTGATWLPPAQRSDDTPAVSSTIRSQQTSHGLCCQNQLFMIALIDCGFAQSGRALFRESCGLASCARSGSGAQNTVYRPGLVQRMAGVSRERARFGVRC